MLVIRRKIGQKVYIDRGRIVLTLTQAGCDWAKIGIEAPAAVSVLRDDLCPEGPSRCCRCGGELPPPGANGVRVAASADCRDEADTDTGRCRRYFGSSLWGELPIGPERKDGVA